MISAYWENQVWKKSEINFVLKILIWEILGLDLRTAVLVQRKSCQQFTEHKEYNYFAKIYKRNFQSNLSHLLKNKQKLYQI